MIRSVSLWSTSFASRQRMSKSTEIGSLGSPSCSPVMPSRCGVTPSASNTRDAAEPPVTSAAKRSSVPTWEERPRSDAACVALGDHSAESLALGDGRPVAVAGRHVRRQILFDRQRTDGTQPIAADAHVSQHFRGPRFFKHQGPQNVQRLAFQFAVQDGKDRGGFEGASGGFGQQIVIHACNSLPRLPRTQLVGRV